MSSLVTFKTEAGHRGAVLRVMCLALMMVVAAVASWAAGGKYVHDDAAGEALGRE